MFFPPNISIHALREEGDPRTIRGSRRRLHFYPRPPRGGRRIAIMNAPSFPNISIHALREEGDWYAISHPLLTFPISIHALREEGDHAGQQLHDSSCDFYPRPPRGGRLNISGGSGDCKIFLSTPSARRATYSRMSMDTRTAFLSTPSARRATCRKAASETLHEISIHALREEGDNSRTKLAA